MNPIAIKLTLTPLQRGVVANYRDLVATEKLVYESAAQKATELETESAQLREDRDGLKRSGRHDPATARDLSTLDVQIETIEPKKQLASQTRDEARSRWMKAVNGAARYIADEFGSEMQQQLNAAVRKAIEPFYSSAERAIHVADKGLAGHTDAGFALRQFFIFQTTANDESLIAAGSAQISSTLESILAGGPAWTFEATPQNQS